MEFLNRDPKYTEGFHGTSVDSAKAIIENGFGRRRGPLYFATTEDNPQLVANAMKHELDKGVQGHVTDIVVFVGEKFAQDVDSHNSQRSVCFNIQDSQNSLVKNCISNILRTLRIRCHLSKNIIDLFTSVDISHPQNTEKP